MNKLCTAPSKVEIVDVSTTTVTVRATAPSGNPAIDAYEASVVGGTSSQKCTVKQSVQPHQCEITGLSPNTAYTISMRDCLPGSSECGIALTVDSRTLPNRELHYFVKFDDKQSFNLPHCLRFSSSGYYD